MAEWGIHERILYELELRKIAPLVGIHVGNRVWYSRVQLTEVLGAPPHGRKGPAQMERDTKGGNLGRFEYEQLRIPEAA